MKFRLAQLLTAGFFVTTLICGALIEFSLNGLATAFGLMSAFCGVGAMVTFMIDTIDK